MVFSVEASNDPHTENAVIDEKFDTEAEARDFFDKLKQRFHAVWISEEGYSVETKEKDWFYFWWSPNLDPDWETPPGRGRGYSCGGSGMVNYVPGAEMVK